MKPMKYLGLICALPVALPVIAYFALLGAIFNMEKLEEHGDVS